MPDDPSATLAGIREREQAATPGEWKHRTAEGRGDWSAGSKVFSIERVEADARPGGIGVIDAWADAEFIAAARTAVPSLVAALEAVLALADEWDAKAKKIGGQIALEDCDGATAGFKMIGYQNHRDHAATLREAITSALAGKE